MSDGAEYCSALGTRRTGALAALVLLVTIGASVFLLPSRMPRYQGKTLRQWLGALPNVSNLSLVSKDYRASSAEDALQQIGPTAVPFLIQMVNARDSAFSDKMKTCLDQWGFIGLPYHHAGDEQIDALKGLAALGPVAKPAIPAVLRLINEGQNDPSRSLFVLARIGPDAIDRNKTNNSLRAELIEALRKIDPETFKVSGTK